MSNPKSPVTDLLRKLKYDTDTAIKNLAAFNTTLESLVARVEEVENLEARAAAAKFQFEDVTRRYRETQAALEQAKTTYEVMQGQLGGAATQLSEIKTKLATM
jgi:hypothetical protein